ncbi:MAG: hypothetical protein ACKVOO_12640, partial [Burkholderiaceae bacterium]
AMRLAKIGHCKKGSEGTAAHSAIIPELGQPLFFMNETDRPNLQRDTFTQIHYKAYRQYPCMHYRKIFYVPPDY